MQVDTKETKVRKDKKGLRRKIMDCAWELFGEKGYNNTTVSDIIRASGTSKGGFYYYFNTKDELLDALHIRFDDVYKRNYEMLDPNMNNYEKLIVMNQCVNYFIDEHVDVEMLRALYMYELKEGKATSFLNDDRFYFQMLREIIQLGQEKGEIIDELSIDEIVEHILNLERGEMFTWCVAQGSYSLGSVGTKHFEMHFRGFRK